MSLCAIGIDIGGTKIAAGLVLPDGEVRYRRSQPTLAQCGGTVVLDDALQLAEMLRQEALAQNFTLAGIGVSICELVDREGNVTSGHTIDWQKLPARARFAEIAPTVIEADVRAHAYAEAHHGAGRNFATFVFISVGTGISSCLVLEGKPFAGARGNALILASSPYTLTCPICGTESNTVLEEIASGPGIVAAYQRRGGQAQRAENVFAALAAGDPAARDAIDSAGAALGNSIGWLVNVLDPEAVIVGGGLGLVGGLFWESLVGSARAHIWAANSRELPILQAALDTDAGLIGAGLQAFTLAQKSLALDAN